VIRVVIAEDQAMVLGALAALLSIEHDIEVVGRPVTGKSRLLKRWRKRQTWC
jgi:two-component system response regulator DesR